MSESIASRDSREAFVLRLTAVAALGLVLRVFVVFWVATQPTSDFWSYYHRGLNLAQHGRYEPYPGKVDAAYPPLYSILLAAVFRIVPGHTLGAAKLLNCLFGIGAAVVAALFARRLWGDGAGLAAAAIFAIFPRYLLMPCLVASENLFSPLILLLLWLVVEGTRRRTAWGIAAAAGAAVALAALTRTVAYYMGALWVLGALAARKRWKTVVLETALLLAVQHVVMLPWAVRNEIRLGRFTFLNTAGGYGLFLGNNPHATGYWYDGRADLEKVAPGVLARGDLAVSDASNAAAWRWIRENPRRAFLLYLKKAAIIVRQTDIIVAFAVSGTKIIPPWPGLDVLPWPHPLKNHLLGLTRFVEASAWTITILGAAGCVLLVLRALRTRALRDVALALLFPAAILYVPALSALIAVNGRYRWPVEDLLVPVAGFALARIALRLGAPQP